MIESVYDEELHILGDEKINLHHPISLLHKIIV